MDNQRREYQTKVNSFFPHYFLDTTVLYQQGWFFQPETVLNVFEELMFKFSV